MSKKIILLSGPTASGKSKLAIKLAKTINGEIINADSMQVYKEFTILSSRPSLSEIEQAKHHLYGFVSVKNYFSAGEWLNKAKSKIKSCVRKNRIPIIVGGTGLYFNTITKGMSKIPEIDFKTRSKVRNLFKKIGPTKFYESLLILDPKVENRIAPTDSQRSQRAYEVILKTKKCLEWFIRYRDPKKTGLISILHPWESGYDNSSLWDEPMNKVIIEKNIQYKRADNKVINPEHRPLNIDYDRYVTIKNDLRKKNIIQKKYSELDYLM